MRRALLWSCTIILAFLPVRQAGAFHAGNLPEGPACVTQDINGITVAVAGLDHPVRLAGVNALGLDHPLGNAARSTLAGYVAETGCEVWLEPASPAWDHRTGHFRAYLWVNSPRWGWFIAQEGLVGLGLAKVEYYPFAEDYYTAHLVGAQRFAQISELGIWSPTADVPRETPTPPVPVRE